MSPPPWAMGPSIVLPVLKLPPTQYCWLPARQPHPLSGQAHTTTSGHLGLTLLGAVDPGPPRACSRPGLTGHYPVGVSFWV